MYLLYWHKGTNTDTPAASGLPAAVLIELTCFTGAQVQILTRLPRQDLLYWYKSTNTDTPAASGLPAAELIEPAQSSKYGASTRGASNLSAGGQNTHAALLLALLLAVLLAD